jgi:hypothetical protein
MTNRYPRLYVTNTITHNAAADLFGPFPSRAAADRYAEQVLDLFLLRHCYQDLDPDPAFPGCIYSEMKKCLAPCYAGCTDARYAEEAARVHAFLSTGGRSLLSAIAAERDQASQSLDFERAATEHARLGKVEAVAALASEAARSLASQYAVIVQPAVTYLAESPAPPAPSEHVALFLIKKGTFSGPVFYSVAGMRHPNEQSGSSSLFAHPVAFAAIPLEPQAKLAVNNDVLEDRLAQAITELERAQQLCDHLSIFTRWYYRPQTKREGEVVFFPAESDMHDTPPKKLLLRAISRVWRKGTSAHPLSSG